MSGTHSPKKKKNQPKKYIYNYIILYIILYVKLVTCKIYTHTLVRERKQMQQVLKTDALRNSLAVQWLGLRALTAKGLGSVPGPGIKIPQATRRGQKKKKKSLKKN